MSNDVLKRYATMTYDERRDALSAALARMEALTTQLELARQIVVKWCHYQGNTEALFDEYLGPIDAALEGVITNSEQGSGAPDFEGDGG